MSEFLGSAFRSFVDHRKVTVPADLSPTHKRPRDTLALTPLRIPQPVHKKMRYETLPNVLVSDSFAPVPLVSPVSILPAPGFPPVTAATCVQSQVNGASQPMPHYAPTSQGFTPQHVMVDMRQTPHLEVMPSETISDSSSSRPCAVHDLIDNGPQQSPLKRPRDPNTALPYRGNHGVVVTNIASNKFIEVQERKWECTHCKSEFNDREILLTHIKEVHQRPFACKVAGCTACFSKQNHLSRHVRIVHNKERPFACTEPGCGSRFGSKSHLGDHTRAVHMRVRDFQCHICGASWSKRFNLEKHIRIRHLGEKPFKCGMCDLSFGTRSHVTRHEMKVHKKVDARVGDVGNRR